MFGKKEKADTMQKPPQKRKISNPQIIYYLGGKYEQLFTCTFHIMGFVT